jgi:redox-sensitive bicupin YhaK (pirin superfamily)
METSDGAGVRIKRSLGQSPHTRLDPYLMLDEFGSDQPQDYIAGFPSHPHRGFETVTYMIEGHMLHEDHLGNRGNLKNGGVQWMTAGRGIVHSEMPVQENGLLWGIQLWINLPARLKMTEPAYREVPAAGIPEETRPDGSRLRVIAGTTAQGTAGPIQGVETAPLFVDANLPAGATLDEPLPTDHTAFALMLEGNATVGGATLSAGHLGAFGTEGARLSLTAGPDGARLLLVHARSLDEPVARGGPFVMNTEAEIRQAIADYQAGRF